MLVYCQQQLMDRLEYRKYQFCRRFGLTTASCLEVSQYCLPQILLMACFNYGFSKLS